MNQRLPEIMPDKESVMLGSEIVSRLQPHFSDMTPDNIRYRLGRLVSNPESRLRRAKVGQGFYLLDEDYQTSVGFPGQGTSFRIGLSYTFD